MYLLERFRIGYYSCFFARCVMLAFGIVAILPESAADALAQTTQPADSPFIFVFIDAKTEKAFGPFPYDRSVLAKGLDKAVSSGAKAVVLKFFIDKPKSPDGDRALALAAKQTKVVLEARLDDNETEPNLLPDRFMLANAGSRQGQLLAGTSGWIPLPALSAAAYDIGFVDYRQVSRMPLVERYRNAMVKSLYLCCIELAVGKHAEVRPRESIHLDGKSLSLDERSEVGVTYPAKDDLPYISYRDLVRPDPRPEIKDKVVIIGYDSDRLAPIDTPSGKLRPHRAFAYALMSIYSQFR